MCVCGDIDSMEASENCSVKVALHIRPLIGDERLQGCKECVTVTPGKPQVLCLVFHKKLGFLSFKLLVLLYLDNWVLFSS